MGLVHDVDHPGLINEYQINSDSELALLYNDNSVLENHHCATAFQILSQPEANIFSGLERNEVLNVLRPLICSLILNTDMKNHFPLMEKFDQLIETSKITANDAELALP